MVSLLLELTKSTVLAKSGFFHSLFSMLHDRLQTWLSRRRSFLPLLTYFFVFSSFCVFFYIYNLLHLWDTVWSNAHEGVYSVIYQYDYKIKTQINTFVSWLISISNKPTLLRGCELFITLRVSEPVYTTTPRADPEATTQFAHKVFSTSRLSSLP